MKSQYEIYWVSFVMATQNLHYQIPIRPSKDDWLLSVQAFSTIGTHATRRK